MRIRKVSQTTPTQAQIVDGYSTSATDGYSARYINQAIGAGGETLKLGTILPFSGSTLPTGYLFCDGSAVSRTTYAGLFDVIGTAFGAGDGSTTFNLPNLKGKVPVGLDSNDTDFDTLGETGGSKFLQNHIHYMGKQAGVGSDTSWGSPSERNTNMGDIYTQTPVDTYGNAITTGNSGNLQPYLVVNYIIKATQTTPTQAQIVDGYSESTTDGYSANYVNNEITNIISSFQNFIGYDDNRIYDYSSTSAGYTKGMFVKDGTGKIYKCLMTGDYPLTNTSAWQRIDFYDVISKESDIVYYNKSDIMSITSTGDDVYLSLLEAITNNIAIGIVENSAVYTSYHEVLYYNKYTNDDAIYLYYMGEEEEYIQIAIKDTDGTFEATETTKIGLRSIKSQVNTNTNNITSNTTNIATLTTNVGALSSLGTTSKTSLVSAVNELNNRDIYSTSEKVIGKWIDGKPIYRKVIKTSVNASGSVSTGISNMDWLVRAYGTALMSGGDIFLPLNFYNGGGWNSFHVTGHGTTIQYQRGTSYEVQKTYFILEYTKK